jgi:hypothetical protein
LSEIILQTGVMGVTTRMNRRKSRWLIHGQDRKLYLQMHHTARKPSRQPIFFPSA